MMKNPDQQLDAILITGPTASGKSALALSEACAHDGVVINADSMQVYGVLRVLTARPSDEEMEGVPHHLYGHVDPSMNYSTGDWLREITPLLAEMKAQGRMPVIVGGTGLYFKALTGGLSDMPEIPDEIRERLRTRLIEEGPTDLYRQLRERDPDMATKLRPGDGQRIVRALEVLEATGRSLASYQGQVGPVVIDPARAKKIVVLPERSLLHQRINRRFETMLEAGAVDEVQALLELGLAADMPAIKAIGVSQISALFRGEMTRDKVIETASAATRQYAKRQMTWFRNQMDDSWERVAP